MWCPCSTLMEWSPAISERVSAARTSTGSSINLTSMSFLRSPDCMSSPCSSNATIDQLSSFTSTFTLTHQRKDSSATVHSTHLETLNSSNPVLWPSSFNKNLLSSATIVRFSLSVRPSAQLAEHICCGRSRSPWRLPSKSQMGYMTARIAKESLSLRSISLI